MNRPHLIEGLGASDMATGLGGCLRQVLPSDELSVHPVVAAQMEPDFLNEMRKAAEISQ